MKRWIRCLALLIAVCLLVPMLAVNALAAPLTYTDKYGTWTYQIEEDGSVTILGCKNAKKNLVIPSELGGKPVKKLGDGLFKDNDTITAVIIPAGVEQIGANVFSGCAKLEQINLPSSLVSIGEEAFSECTKLSSLYIPTSVKEIDDGAFKDNPQLHVTCEMGSAAAEYLEKNRSELGSYTVLKVTPTSTKEPEETVSQEPVIKGKLVTYSFGKKINGKSEFTLVVADSMPNLKLSDYIKYDKEYDDYYFDDRLDDLLENRFKLVSLSRFDGTHTQELDGSDQKVWFDVYPCLDYDTVDGVEQFELEYEFSVSGDTVDRSIFPGNIQFNEKNELVEYALREYDEDHSTVKENGQYTQYNQHDSTTTRYQSDGKLISTSENESASAHRFGVKGTCVEISISYYKSTDSDGESYEYKDRDVRVYNSDTKTRIYASSGSDQYQMNDGSTKSRNTSSYNKTENGIRTEHKYSSSTYNEDGDLISVSNYSDLPGVAGTYELIDANLDITYQWDSHYETHWTDDDGNFVDTDVENHHKEYNDLIYHETVIRAENVDEAYDRTYAYFPNDPDEHTYDVSERKIDSVDLHKWESTETDLNTGEVTHNSGAYKYEELSDHTYVGNTGKYVGWDWSWWYDVEEEKTTLTSYTVTEYTYTAEDDVWTKTTVNVSPTEYSDGSYDFKTTFPEELLNSYNMNSTTYVFNDALDSESGEDHWEETEYSSTYTYETPDGSRCTSEHYTNEAEDIDLSATNGNDWSDGEPLSQEEKELLEQKQAAAEAIIRGETTVQAGEETLSQEKKKDDLLDLMEELKDPANYEEDYFEEVLEEMVPDGEEILEELKQDVLPESNVDDSENIECPNHDDFDYTEDEAPEAEPEPEPVTEHVAEAVAEPVSEPVAEPASEPVCNESQQ